MENILYPQQRHDRGLEVRNLHDAFIALADKPELQGVRALFTERALRETFEREVREQVYGEATVQVITAFQEKYMTVSSNGIIDEATAGAINALLQKYGIIKSKPVVYAVYGTIYDKWIEPMTGALVMAFDQDMRQEHLLGEAETDEKGQYSIIYTKEKLTGAGKSSTDIIVRVYDKNGSLLQSSGTYVNAPVKLQADISLGPRAYMGPSEFSLAVAAIEPYIGRLGIGELTENATVHDLSFLLGKITLPAKNLLQIVAAFRFVKWTNLEAGVFYGILAQGQRIKSGTGNTLPEDVDGTIEQAYVNFWNLPVSDMINFLQQAAAQNIVAYKLLAHEDAIKAKLQQLKNAPPQIPGSTVTQPIVYAQVTIAGLNAVQQQVFLENYQPESISPSLWTTLSADPNFNNPAGQATLGKLQMVYQLSGWTADNTDLVSYLINEQKINAVDDLASLVDNDINDWVNIINQSGTVPTGSTDAGNAVQTIAASIAAGIEKIYPTPVFTSRLKKNTTFKLSNRDYITGVLSNSDFDITKSSIGAYLDAYAQKKPVPEETDIKTITYQMLGMQRVYKVSQSADASLALLSDNIQSARQIYAMGRSNFVSQYQSVLGSETIAGALFDQAGQIHTGAAFLAGRLVSTLNNPATNMMPDYNAQVKNSKFLAEYPDLAGLFGMPASYCECVDCESFLGIPAYLADLLDYLFQRKTTTGSNARATLLANDYTSNGLRFRRRPDIGDIDLNCDNTNIELPYIDVVNELLEDYIIPPISAIKMKLSGSGNTIYQDFLHWIVTHLTAGTIKAGLYNLLKQIAKDPKTPICNIDLLTPKAVVSHIFYSDGENYPDWMMGGRPLIAQWIIRDEYITLKISLLTSARYIAQLNAIFGTDLITAVVKNTGKPDSKYLNDFSSVFTNEVFTNQIDENGDRETRYFGLVVQEIHQTHLTTDEINANPEYTNTNVYNSFSDPFNSLGNNKWSLYPTRIPISLPYDLYFDEANTFLEKMGKQRYDFINTFRKQGPASANSIVIAYLGLSTGDADIIFTPRIKVPPAKDPQLKFWGKVVSKQPEVDLFLKDSGLDFEQLQTLLTLSFINPLGDSYIAGTAVAGSGPGAVRLPPPTIYDTCNTALMVITNMTSEKFDHINRFLRLWNKLNLLSTLSMQELNDCIMSPAIGNGNLDLTFAEALFYFLQLMQQTTFTATQTLAFYQDIDTARDNSLYQQLFQNRQISNPLVAAFNLPLAGTTRITDTHANQGAIPVILTACGITQDDLTAVMNLDSPAHTLLTVDNLSFIYACGLMANALSISVADLFTFANLLGINPLYQILPLSPAATPLSTFTFISKYNEIQQAGFEVDDLNYVLCNQSVSTPSLVPDATTVVTGLQGIRSALQSAITATTAAPDPKGTLLTKWLADPDLKWDRNIAAKLLSILAATDDSTYITEVQRNLRMLQLLRAHYGQSSAAAYLDRLPSVIFPDNTIADIQYDSSNYYLWYHGTMSPLESQFLNQLPSIDAAGQAAVQVLYQQSQSCPISAVPAGGSSIPAWVSSNQAQISQNVAGFSCAKGALGFKGAMSAQVYSALLAQSTDAGYGCAISQLLIASQGTSAAATTYVQLGSLPAIALPGAAAASLAFSNGLLSVTGAMSAADCQALLGLSNDPVYQAAICQLFITAQPGQTVSTPLPALPSGWAILPDLGGIAGISSATGVVRFYGQMSDGVKSALNNLSSDADWNTTANMLYNQSQSAVLTTAPVDALPAGVTDASFGIYGVTNTTPAGQTTPVLLTYTGVMSDYILDGLLALSTDTAWSAAITVLYQNTQATLVTTVTLTQPSDIDTSMFAAYMVSYSASGTAMTLSFTGQMPAQVQGSLIGLSADATYIAAINSLFSQTSAIFGVSLPSVNVPLAATGLGSTTYTTGAIVFNGAPNVLCNDEFNLQQLGPDTRYMDAISFIYTQPPLPPGTIGAVLSALPAVAFPAGINILWANGQLSFTGQMQTADFNVLLGLSANSSYQAAVTTLFNYSQITTVTAIPALADGSFPDGVAVTDLNTSGVNVQNHASAYVLSFTGVMTSTQQNALLALVPPATNDDYTEAVQTLFKGSQTIVITTTPLAALPPVTIPAAAITAGWNYDQTNGILFYSGVLPIPAGAVSLMNNLNSTDPDFGAAINVLSAVTTNPGDITVFAPPPQTAFASSAIVLANGAVISYQGGTLAFTGPMPFADYVALLSFSSDIYYREAVNNVYIASQPVASNVTVNSTNYFDLPEIIFPGIYSSQVSFSPATSMLTLRGCITTADLAVLSSLGAGFAYQQALNLVYHSVDAQDADIAPLPKLYETLLTGTNIALPQADRYTYFLGAISADYQAFKESDALTVQIASVFGVTTAVAAVLNRVVFADFTASSFTGNSKALNPDPDQFMPAKWFMKLTRIAFLVNTFNLSASDTAWLLQNGASISALELDAWPTSASPLTFDSWEVLNNLCLFQRKYKALQVADIANPGQNVQLSVYDIISAALTIQQDISAIPVIASNPGDLIAKLVRLTGWNIVELSYLLNIGIPALPALLLNPLQLTDTGIPPVGCIPNLSDIALLLRLSDCFVVASQLKAVPSRCITWATDPLTDTIATDIKQALKSIYPDESSWKSTVQPLMNTLRQNRRDALVEYLESNTVTNPFGSFDIFPDQFAVYGNFLIDVEMAACQPTTRTIQAYCSIQLFVERCLLNLESPNIKVDSTLDEDWLQWGWMGTFEGWYEARYTFLYPENFIIPEALPNQSAFFSDMQNDLTQGAVTADIVKTAFGNYLENLDQVARLEVKGMWFDEPTSTLHVFACTYGGDPAVYYYRTLNSTGQWSAWELVTADISGSQIIPVVQNGRLYLYWPVYSQATDEDKKTQKQSATNNSGTTTTSSPPPNKYWQIQMAFSEYLNGAWTGKKLSKDYLSSGPILVADGNPVVHPDTSDFVFFAVDVPLKNSNAYKGTIDSLQMNNNVAIACYLPDKINVRIVGNLVARTLFDTLEIDIHLDYKTAVDINNPTIPIQDLLNTFSPVTIFPKTYDFTSNGTFNLLAGDPVSVLETKLNGVSSGLTGLILAASISSVTYSAVSPDSLSVLAKGGLNSFILDPARGYATAIDLGTLGNYTDQVSHLWFKNSSLDDMLTEGNGTLTTHNGAAVLSPSNHTKYANLLPLQMGLWAKYAFFKENKIDLSKTGIMMPFFYQDSSCAFYVQQSLYTSNKWRYYAAMEDIFKAINGNASQLASFFSSTANLSMDSGPFYQFNNFYHPFTHQFIKIFAQRGIESILTRPIQLTGDAVYGGSNEVKNNLIVNNPAYHKFNFDNTYAPSGKVIIDSSIDTNYPIEQMDFGLFSSYGRYNWELFFHAVLMSAIRLSQNQQFEDADTWFKFIFNPTDTSAEKAPQKFWVTKPFFENVNTGLSIDELILFYEMNPASQPLFWESVKLWRNDPYDPHMLAQYRITPYMYTTFMKYLDNLIAWANFNYTQYTMESVNIAIQLFMTALECLGTKPEAIPPVVETPVCNYYQLELDLEILSAIDGKEGYLSDPIVQFENLLPPASPGYSPGSPKGSSKKVQMLPGLYFCIPPNQVLLGYWTTIETQLNKIRNCLNIKGQFQPLNPFPSIPGMGSMDGTGISDWGGVIPNYRFTIMLQKASEICNEVKMLGAALLSCLEKRDAEGIAVLRATQEVRVQKAVDIIKNLQITDANLSLQNLQQNQVLLNDKIAYYNGLIQAGLLSLETQALALNQFSLSLEGPIASGNILAGNLKQLPNFTIGINGAFGSPAATATFGGSSLGEIAESGVQYLSYLSHFADKSATLAATNAGYTRRLAEWNYQLTLAKDELAQVNTQVQAAQNKIAIATQEAANQQLLIQNAEDVEDFLKNKYTSQQLYSWMITQISDVYFQSYQLAYSVAKQAEICFRYELGITETSYVNYGYWDSLHKGLLSGEGLMSSIRQMEMDYMSLNMREYELTRQVSLAQFDPVALLQLKANGNCFISLPEELFDVDYPGHYFRRIKHIAVTIPGVVGPYTPVCLKMTLMNNSVRIDNIAGSAASYPRHTDSKGAPTNDSRFIDNVAATQYIATSNGVNDSGLFEMNLHDDRYLPFERAGAISSWQLEFSGVYQQFDPRTITDLIIHFSYTSREGGTALRTAATQSAQSKLKNIMTSSDMILLRGFSARRDFPTQWYQFLNPANPGDTQQLVMDISQRFPYFTNGLTIKISQVVLVADVPTGNPGGDVLSNLYISGQKLSNALISFGPEPEFGPMLYGTVKCKDMVGTWKITNGAGQDAPSIPINGNGINDLSIIFYYSVVNNNT